MNFLPSGSSTKSGMTREDFDALVQRLEGVSRRNPARYRARIVGLVVFAYAYLLLVLLGSLALCAAMIALVFAAPAAIKLALVGIIAFGGIFIGIMRGLWVRIPSPKGDSITRAQAPKLFALLDELRLALNCKPFHAVAIIGDVNAGVVQVPRLGIFGWHKNYLVIGLPLMQMMAPDELKAVLAHEFAHSSRGHGSFSNWLYRVRRTWDQVFQQMVRQRSRLGFALFKFANWYWPIFNGHAFVLARANEYEADACSVRLTGADAAARALIRLRVQGSLLSEKFWPDTFARAKQEHQPPGDIADEVERALKRGPAPEDAARWLRQAFVIETNNNDTHPCLKDRLRAIGRLPPEIEAGKFPETPPPLPTRNAAEFFLGAHAAVSAQKLSEDWKYKIASAWKQRHIKAQKLVEDLAKLETARDTPPTTAEAWQKASQIVELHGDAAAVTALQNVLALDPNHTGAHFILGRHFLQADDARGIEHMENAMSSDPLLTQTGCNLLYAHFNRTGQRDKLRPLEHRFDNFQKLNNLARQERAKITVSDIFQPHALTPAQLAELQAACATEADIGRVAIARKQVQHFPKSPCFGVAVEVKVPWWQIRRSVENRHLVQRFAKRVKLPGNTIVFVREKNLNALGTKILKVPGSIIYQRTK
jgi:Zn-dependent protease with chaperone function